MITTVVGGDVHVADGKLDARYPKGIWEIRFVDDNQGDIGSFRREVEEDGHGRLSDKCRKGCGGCEHGGTSRGG